MGQTLRARDVFRQAEIILLDKTNQRWPLDELRKWLNAGLREIALVKPNATATRRSWALQAGSLQELPGNGTGLLRVIRNVRAGDPPVGRGSVTTISREMMDAQVPDWHDSSVHTPTQIVVHAIHDEADPTRYYVWPPNDGTGRLEIIYAKLPDNVEIPDNPTRIGSYSVLLDVDDVYESALVDYVLYRAFSKDAQNTTNAARALGHRAAFDSALGIKSAGEAINPDNRT